jgi:hypothetical protein
VSAKDNGRELVVVQEGAGNRERPPKRLTVWVIGSSDDITDAEARFVDRLVPNFVGHLAQIGVRLVLGESGLLLDIARAYRAALAGLHHFVPHPIVIVGNMRRYPSRLVFSETIGQVPDLAIIIGGRVQRRRVADEYQRAKEAGIPIISLGFTGGAAATLPSTVPNPLDHYVGKPITSLDVGDIAAKLGQFISEAALANVDNERARGPLT